MDSVVKMIFKKSFTIESAGLLPVQREQQKSWYSTSIVFTSRDLLMVRTMESDSSTYIRTLINEPIFECEICTRRGDLIYEQHGTGELKSPNYASTTRNRYSRARLLLEHEEDLDTLSASQPRILRSASRPQTPTSLGVFSQQLPH